MYIFLKILADEYGSGLQYESVSFIFEFGSPPSYDRVPKWYIISSNLKKICKLYLNIFSKVTKYKDMLNGGLA